MKTSILGLAATVILSSTQAAAVAISPQSTKLLQSRQDLSHSVEDIADDLKSMGKDQAAGLDTPQCLWESTGPGGIGAINFYLQIPNWQATFNQDTAVNDLKGSLGGNAACASGEKTLFQWNIIGNAPTGGPGTNSTLAATVFASSFCTAYQMTKVIHATTGLPGIACVKAAPDDSPDGTKPDTADPVDGSDGYETPEIEPEVGVERRGSSLDEGHTVWITGGPDSGSSKPSRT